MTKAPAPPAPAKEAPGKFNWRTVALLVFLAASMGLAGWMIFGQMRAWGAIAAGKAALKAGDLPTAIKRLEEANRVYPSSDEITFLLGQAYRRAGNLRQARREFAVAARLGWVKEAIALEERLMDAQEGARGAESVLEKALEAKHPEAGLIYEVLVPLALSRYDVIRAGGLLDGWLELEPENGLAWAFAGRVAEIRRDRSGAIEAYQKALKYRPELVEVRRPLTRLLLDTNRTDEAGPHVEALLKAPGKDAEVLRLQAQYLILKGEGAEARALLDGLLLERKDDPPLLHLRGKLELNAGQPARAAEYLGRAMARDGYERELLFTWARCLRALDRNDEAARMEARLKGVEADLDRVRELTAKAAGAPWDPAPRREVGEIFLRNEQVLEGVRWLHGALQVAPADAATHRALAAHYEKARPRDKGEEERFKALAEQHRKAAAAAPKAGG